MSPFQTLPLRRSRLVVQSEMDSRESARRGRARWGLYAVRLQSKFSPKFPEISSSLTATERGSWRLVPFISFRCFGFCFLISYLGRLERVPYLPLRSPLIIRFNWQLRQIVGIVFMSCQIIKPHLMCRQLNCQMIVLQTISKIIIWHYITSKYYLQLLCHVTITGFNNALFICGDSDSVYFRLQKCSEHWAVHEGKA